MTRSPAMQLLLGLQREGEREKDRAEDSSGLMGRNWGSGGRAFHPAAGCAGTWITGWEEMQLTLIHPDYHSRRRRYKYLEVSSASALQGPVAPRVALCRGGDFWVRTLPSSDQTTRSVATNYSTATVFRQVVRPGRLIDNVDREASELRANAATGRSRFDGRRGANAACKRRRRVRGDQSQLQV